MKKIGIFCLGHRRQNFIETIAIELSKSNSNDYHFYLLGNNVDSSIENNLKEILGGTVTVVNFEVNTNQNYLNKLRFAISMDHQYLVKYDEDCLILSESWDKFFDGICSMTDSDLLYSGVVSNGIPTVELFLQNHANEIKDKLFKKFNDFNLGVSPWGVNYDSLNLSMDEWDPDIFYKKVSNFPHHYKGIHPVRLCFDAIKHINDHIIENFNDVMKPKQLSVIKDENHYPYICNNLYGMKTKNLKEIFSSPDLFVDVFDEVPVNRYRHETRKNLVFDLGIPVFHSMYNSTPNPTYEENLMKCISGIIKK